MTNRRICEVFTLVLCIQLPYKQKRRLYKVDKIIIVWGH